jgi:hypothetical protein
MLMAFCLCLSIASASGGELRAGAAAVVITPPSGAAMAGYYQNRAAAGVHDDLYAKAIVFEKDGVRAVLATCDLVSIPGAVVLEARTLIQQSVGIPPSFVMISATHTHTGPIVMEQPSRYNLSNEGKRIADDYTAALPGKIAEAVQNAAAALQPAQMRSAIGIETSLPFNRRYFMKDGTIGWNPGKLNPNTARPAGPVDPAVPLIYVETLAGKPIASYVNYAIHSDTMSGNLISADFSSTLSQILKNAKGAGLLSMFTMGCAGNVNHIDVNSETVQSGPNETARIGSVLAGEVLKTIGRAPIVPVSSIRAESEVVKLPLPKVEPAEVAWARKTAATFGQPDAAKFGDLVRAAKIVEVADRHGAPLEAEVQVIALGDQVVFVGLPAEIFVELGLTLKEDSPFPNTMIATLANGALGYIPNRSAYYEGGYEALSSRGAPGSGEMLMDSAFRQLFQLFKTRP